MGLAQKTSITLAGDDLAAAKKAAAARDLSLSAFLATLIREHIEQEARFAAMDHLLRAHHPGHKLSDAARRSIEAEWTAPLKPVRRRR